MSRYLETSKDTDEPPRVNFDDDDGETICELDSVDLPG